MPSALMRGRLERHNLARVATHEGRDARRHSFRRRLHGISRKVCVAGSRLHLGVAEQLTDHGQALAESDGARGEGVAQIVDAHVREADQ